MGINSRAHMEAVIRNGCSVMLPDLRLVTRVENLPTQNEIDEWEVRLGMAEPDPNKRAAAAHDLQDQIGKLQAELARLQGTPIVEPEPAELPTMAIPSMAE